MIIGSMFPRPAAYCSLALIAALATPIASSQPQDEGVRNASIDELKAVFLVCDRAAMSRPLASSEVFHCSLVYEALKQRAFGGSFDRLLAWYQASAATRTTGQKN